MGRGPTLSERVMKLEYPWEQSAIVVVVARSRTLSYRGSGCDFDLVTRSEDSEVGLTNGYSA